VWSKKTFIKKGLVEDPEKKKPLKLSQDKVLKAILCPGDNERSECHPQRLTGYKCGGHIISS